MSRYSLKPYQSVYRDPQSVAINTLQRQKFQQAFNADDAIAGAVDQMQAADFEGDQALKMELEQNTRQQLQDRAARGDYETMVLDVSKSAREFDKNYQPIKQNYEMYQAYKKRVQDAYNKGDINALTYNKALAKSNFGYSGLERNEDGSITKHGSTFKASTRSRFYKNTIDRITNARLDNKTGTSIADEVYDFDHLPIEEFVQRRRLNRKLSDYVSETDMMITLATQGESIGIKPLPMTTYEYYKTKDGYKIKELTTGKSELDVRYYWDIVSRLLEKFGLKHLIRKNPPLTILDKKQKSLMEFV